MIVLVGGLSEEGNKLITKSRQKYLSAFSQLIRQGLPEETTASQVLQRISKLMMLLPIAERIAQMDDNTIVSVLTNIYDVINFLCLGNDVRVQYGW